MLVSIVFSGLKMIVRTSREAASTFAIKSAPTHALVTGRSLQH